MISHYDSHCNIAQKATSGHFEGHLGHNGSVFWHYRAVCRFLRRILGLTSCCQCPMVISCPSLKAQNRHLTLWYLHYSTKSHFWPLWEPFWVQWKHFLALWSCLSCSASYFGSRNMLSVFHGHFLPPPWRPKIDTSHYDTHCNTAQKAISGHFEGHFGQNGSLWWHYRAVYRVLRRILGLKSCCQCPMVISCPLHEDPKSTPPTITCLL